VIALTKAKLRKAIAFFQRSFTYFLSFRTLFLGVKNLEAECWRWTVWLLQILTSLLLSSMVAFLSQCCTSLLVIITDGIKELAKLKASLMFLYMLKVIQLYSSVLIITDV
jgi:hypothetical protein